MDYTYKALDYFKKLYRAGQKIFIFEKDGFYWLCNGFFAIRIPEKSMEFNPTLFIENKKLQEAVFKENIGVELKNLNLQEKLQHSVAMPFKGEGFIAWIDKKYFDMVPEFSTFYSTKALDSITVKCCDEVIGIILPIRHPEELPNLFGR